MAHQLEAPDDVKIWTTEPRPHCLNDGVITWVPFDVECCREFKVGRPPPLSHRIIARLDLGAHLPSLGRLGEPLVVL